jgi:transcriptional regulator with XRE-family HTH domain
VERLQMTQRVQTAEELQYLQALRTWRERRRLSKADLARAIAYDPSRVSHIEAGRQPPTEEFTRQVEAALQTGGELWERWEAIATSRFGLTARPRERELRTVEFVSWLADHSDASFPTVYASVCALVERSEAEPPSIRHSRSHARRHAARDQLARAVVAHYSPQPELGSFYRASVGGTDYVLSIVAPGGWLDGAVELGGDDETCRFVGAPPASATTLDAVGLDAAVHRLADAELNGTVMMNNPLYRLLSVDIDGGRLGAEFSTAEFAEHAMTSELIEGELIDSLSAGHEDRPLRDLYLPTIGSAFELAGRTCVGGAVSLLAVARNRPDGQRDYVLLAQERSAVVLNLAGKLAVVPKGFHQPTGEPADEVRLSTTLRREFEEELLGREDLEQIAATGRQAVDLLHPGQLTDPMAWLLDQPGAFRVETTGFGFNMVTGNYEFACLIVIDDPTWWDQYGHLLATNWEAERVHRYSTLDTEGLVALVADPRWGNESLFALLQGLRRLTQLDHDGRTAIPPVEGRPA